MPLYSGARRDTAHTHTHTHTRTHTHTGGIWKEISRWTLTDNTEGKYSPIIVFCATTPYCRRSSLPLSSYHAASLALPLSESVSPHQLSLSCLSHRFKISLSLPPLALSALPTPAATTNPQPSPPHLLLLLLLLWPLSLSLSLSLALSFFFPSLSLSLSLPLSLFCLPLTLFFSLSHSLLASPLPPAFCCAAVPLPAHLLCLFSSLPPLSHPDSPTPPRHTCKLAPPSRSSLVSQSLPPLSLPPPLSLSLIPSVLFLHVGELNGAAGTTGRARANFASPSPSPLSDMNLVT